MAAAALAAVEFLGSGEGEERRKTLWERIGTLRASLPRRPWDGVPSPTPSSSGSAIHPWMVGDEQEAIDLARSLQAEGFLVPAIRYPTVAKGSARLRITVTAAHAEAQIRALAAALTRHSRAGMDEVAAPV